MVSTSWHPALWCLIAATVVVVQHDIGGNPWAVDKNVLYPPAELMELNILYEEPAVEMGSSRELLNGEVGALLLLYEQPGEGCSCLRPALDQRDVHE
jgi:hypothetical protein